MASGAAIINRSGPGDHEAFDTIVARSPAEIRQLAHAVRNLVFEVLPATIEVVWQKQGSVGWGTGPKKFSEQFCYFMPFAKHVTLGFYYGGDLPDPARLLAGGGRQVSGKLSMRSIKIADMGELQRPELRALVATAVRHLTERHEGA